MARESIAALGTTAVPALLQALQEDRLGGVGKGQVLYLLGHLALAETLPAVLAAVKDPRHIVKSSAMAALSSFSGPSATAALVALLRDPDSDVVKHAAGLLGHRKDEAAVEALMALLKQDETGVRYSAARALGEIGGPRSHAALMQHHRHETDGEILSLIRSSVAGARPE
jgi:HEAT repeat protein